MLGDLTHYAVASRHGYNVAGLFQPAVPIFIFRRLIGNRVARALNELNKLTAGGWLIIPASGLWIKVILMT